MADETIGVFTQIPSVGDVSKQLNATPEQLQAQSTDFLMGAVQDLVSGKNPLQSKTLLFNGALILVGIAGSIYTMLISGNTAAAVPFLLTTGTGAINSVLRLITSGPILTNAMQKLMGAYASITPQQT